MHLINNLEIEFMVEFTLFFNPKLSFFEFKC